MDASSSNRRRHPRLFRNVRFLFYFLGQTREVYTVDISYAGAFIQTDVFPPLGSFIILEHYHLKKREITLGLVGKIQRIQTPFQNAPSVRGVGVEWVRSYCNQGFMPMKQFLERDLGSQPFDWDTHLLYERYSRKLVFDFKAESLSPSPKELEAILGTRRGAAERERARESAEVRADKTPPSGMRAVSTKTGTTKPLPGDRAQAGGVSGAGVAPTAPQILAAKPSATRERVFAADESGEHVSATEPGPAQSSEFAAVPAGEASDGELVSAESLKTELHETEIKIVFGSGNRMFYGVVRAISEKALYVETSSDRVVRENAKIQVRLPLSTKNYRYMVIIYGRVEGVSRDGDGLAFRMRIDSIDEFQNPGGFRYFVEGLAAE
jgi:hypothetical protein